MHIATKSLADVYSQLPLSLQPPANLRRKGYRIGRQAAIEYVEHMYTLPEGLKPLRGVHYTPPKFVYGWLLSNDDICAIIERYHPDCLMIGNRYDEDYIDIALTFREVRKYFKHLEIDSRWKPDRVGVVDVVDYSYQALSITDSYENGNALPPNDVMQTMMEFFHLREEPRWFLNIDHDRWEMRRIYRRRNGELVATTDF